MHLPSLRDCYGGFPEILRFVNFTIFVNSIEDIDTDRQRITLDITLAMSWQDTRISCPRCGAAEVTDPDNN